MQEIPYYTVDINSPKVTGCDTARDNTKTCDNSFVSIRRDFFNTLQISENELDAL